MENVCILTPEVDYLGPLFNEGSQGLALPIDVTQVNQFTCWSDRLAWKNAYQLEEILMLDSRFVLCQKSAFDTQQSWDTHYQSFYFSMMDYFLQARQNALRSWVRKDVFIHAPPLQVPANTLDQHYFETKWGKPLEQITLKTLMKNPLN